MFDFSIWEIGLVLLVALLVIGPKQLPDLARTLGRWLRYGRNSWKAIKADMEQTIAQDEQTSKNDVKDDTDDRHHSE